MQSTPGARPQNGSDYTRYGCFPIVIGATLEHRLTKRHVMPSGRILTAGQKIHAEVQDLTRHPETDGHAQWLCRNPHCAGKTWTSKKELVASHPDTRELKRNMEVHCFYAVAHVPAFVGVPEVVNKAGDVTAEAVPAKPAAIILLSDEE